MSARGSAARRTAAAVLVLAATASGCGGPGPQAPRDGANRSAAAALPDVRIAKGRPPLVLVAREGDPALALAAAVSTAGLAETPETSPELAVALAGVLEARLAAAGVPALVVPSWDGYRASWLARTEAEATSGTKAVRAALLAPLTEDDLAAAKKKLAALAARPLRDPALAAWARCTGSPYAAAERAPRLATDVTLAKLEASRRAAHGTGRVALAVVGPSAATEATWSAIAKGEEWPEAEERREEPARGAARVESAVYEAALDGASPLEVHLTLEMPTASASVGVAEALGDARGPLAARLAALEPSFRLREVAGAAHRDHGCVGVVLDVAPGARVSGEADALAPRVADAVALVHAEASVHLGEGASRLDGRVLARRAGDVQRAAERAAFWGLVAPAAASPGGIIAPGAALGGSVALGLGPRRGGSPREAREAQAPATRAAPLAAAVERAIAAVRTPVVEGRTRVEAGQGEAWLLFASPCGLDAETDVDAGLAAVVAVAAAEVAEAPSDARVEPWVTDAGVGLLVHGAPREGESPRAHARRLADVVGRAVASAPLSPSAITRARAEVSRLSSPGFAELGGALAPRHPSWLAPFGREEVTRSASDAAVSARAQALRAGPLRLAVLADADQAQAEAAVRAVDRWVERRVGDAERVCAPRPEALPVRAGTYAAERRPGAMPEAWLAWPLPAGDAATREAALVLAAALEGLLERALGGATPLATSWQARVVGAPRVPALTIRVTARDASLDAAVLQVRALVDRVRQGGLPAADVEAASRVLARSTLASSLDPRARLVATFRGEAPTSAAPKVSPEQLRAVASRHLGEDALVVVAARARSGATP